METDSKDKFIPVSLPGGIPGIKKGFTENIEIFGSTDFCVRIY